jgi:DNA-binding transcriptional LysR family regulator
MSIAKTDAPQLVGELRLRWIEAFRATMRTGNVSGAARLLGVSQPAVSQHLKLLEEAGGVRLFDRRRGRLLPTAQAHALLAEVERVYTGLESVRRRLQALQAHAFATLHVGSLHALGMGFMPRVVARFVTRFPQSRVELSLQSSTELRDAVADGALDLAVVADEVDTTGLAASLFYERPAVCLLPSRHWLARRSHVVPADLDGEPFVVLAPGDRTRHRIEAVLAKAGVTPRIVVETPYGSTQCALVQAGVGVALVNPLTARDLARQHGAVIRPFVPEIPFRAMLVFPAGRALGDMTKAFVSECRSELASQPSGG